MNGFLVFCAIACWPDLGSAQTSNNTPDLTYYLLFAFLGGITSFIALITIVQYWFQKDKALLYYTLYLIGFGFYIIFETCHYPIFRDYFKFVYEHREMLESTANFFPNLMYYLFVKHFLHFKKEQPKMARFMDKVVIVESSYLVLDLLFFHGRFFAADGLLFGLVSIYIFFQIYRIKNRLVFYILTGTGFYLIGSCWSFYLQETIPNDTYPGIWTAAFLYDGAGALLEIICFFIGFVYRFKIAQEEKEQIAIQLALKEERHKSEKHELVRQTRIKLRMDLHDFANSTLGAVKGNCSILKYSEHLDELQAGYQETEAVLGTVLERMDDLISLLNPERDTVVLMEETAIKYYLLFFKGQEEKVLFNFESDARLNGQKLDLNIADTLLSVIIESLYNIQKYAQCSAIDIRVGLPDPNTLELMVKDNGIGFDPVSAPLQIRSKGGRGLSNMKKRAKDLLGDVKIGSGSGGTTIQVFLPIHIN
jgi:signal transduction histidine kinase